MPAPAIEEVVVKEICRTLRDRPRLIEVLGFTQTPPTRMKAILSRASNLEDRLRAAGPAEQRELIEALVSQVEVRRESICINLRRSAFQVMVGAGESSKDQEPETAQSESDITLDVPVTFKRRGVEMKLILANEHEPRPKPDPVLIKAVAEGHIWFEELRSGTIPSVGDLAEHHGINQGDVSRRLPLAFLAPVIVEAILDGRQPIELTAARIMRIRDLPLSWAEQRRRLGITN